MSRKEETLDPKNWDELRSLGHEMLNDMMKYNETIRDQLYTPPNEEALKAIRVPMPMKGDGEEKVYQIFKE